jgi:holliday junction DNA helicase RuvA
MISFIRGQLIEKYPTHAIVENNGVGLEILIPVSTFEKIGAPNDNVTLLTYLHVREEALTLFGFATSVERELFRDVLSVSGIGPKLALGILSGASVEQTYQNIADSNENSLIQIKGLGRKTAQRLILDLRDRAIDKVKQIAPSTARYSVAEREKAEQGILAMISLGYSKKEAGQAIEKVLAKIGDDAAVEDLIRLALSGG